MQSNEDSGLLPGGKPIPADKPVTHKEGHPPGRWRLPSPPALTVDGWGSRGGPPSQVTGPIFRFPARIEAAVDDFARSLIGGRSRFGGPTGF